MFDFINNWWTSAKAWFKQSLVIFWARIQALAGLIVGILGAIDWSSIATWDLTSKRQTIWLGVGLFVNGVVTELARRKGTVETTNNQLVPASMANKVQVKK